ncbi:MAG: hypothetical protein AAFV53_36870 [Myxococcota bacterium]
MRKVAAKSGLSLSNVQYHYRTRALLLIGITDRHLAHCRESLITAAEPVDPLTLRNVLEISLLNENVRATAGPFRDLFALAKTEPAVHQRLMAHFRDAHQQLTALLGTIAPLPREELDEVATIIMTALEGAYLISEAMPVSPERFVDRLDATARIMLGQAPRSR